MNDIQQLIDRYLAEGLSSDELARLSRAVHRDDAPEEWGIIREMIDTLSEGEDDYDLLMAARIASSSSRTLSMGRGWRIAASVLLVTAIGATLYFSRHSEPELANAKKDSVSAPAQSVNPVEATTAAEAKASLETPASPTTPAPSAASVPSTAYSSPATPAKKGLVVETRPASQRSRISASAPATSDIAETNEESAVAYDVPERRIYSCNLLDQISDFDDVPATATDSY